MSCGSNEESQASKGKKKTYLRKKKKNLNILYKTLSSFAQNEPLEK